jgi:hypothetical protein
VFQEKRKAKVSSFILHNFFTKCLFKNEVQKTYDGEKAAFQQMLLGKAVINLQKTETRSMPVTLYYYHLKVD